MILRRMAGCYNCGRVEFVSSGFRPHDLPCHIHARNMEGIKQHNAWDWIENFIDHWDVDLKGAYTSTGKEHKWTQKNY